MLTDAQKRCFDRRATLTAMDERAAGEILLRLERSEAERGGFVQLLRFKAHLRLAALMDAAPHPRILDAVEDLIGPNILLFTSAFWPKDGVDRRYVSWHEDSAYFGFDRHEEVTARVALTPSHAGNGLYTDACRLDARPPHRDARAARIPMRSGTPGPCTDDELAIDAFIRRPFHQYCDQEQSGGDA
jgi:hypothetical protein